MVGNNETLAIEQSRVQTGLVASASAETTSTPSVLPQQQPISPPAPALTPTPQPTPTPNPPVAPLNSVEPVTLRIAAIKLIAPIIKTGLEPDGSLHVPSSPDMTGWYDLGPRPGEAGPSVITGHYDSAAGPGILYNLKNVKIGDTIEVVRNDGSVAKFSIDKLQRYPQDNFNTQAVYGSVSDPELRIITCSGVYSKQTGHYSDDLVVFAKLKSIEQPQAYQPL